MAKVPLKAGPWIRWKFLVAYFLTEAAQAGVQPVGVIVHDFENQASHPGTHKRSHDIRLIAKALVKLERFLIKGTLENGLSLITVDGRVVAIVAMAVEKKYPWHKAIDLQHIVDSRPHGFEDWFRTESSA